MCSSEEIIEISDGEDETDMPPLPSAMGLLQKASELLAKPVDSTEKVDLDAVSLLIKRAMDLQNIKQENDISEPGQVNVISTTDMIVKSEHPSPIEPIIDVLEVKTENFTEKPCSTGQLTSMAVSPDGSQAKPTENTLTTENHQKLPDMPDINVENSIEQEPCPLSQSVSPVSFLEPQQNTIENIDTAESLPNTSLSIVEGPANVMQASNQTPEMPDLTDEMNWDASTEILVAENEVKSNVSCDSDQSSADDADDDPDWTESGSSENWDECINAASNISEDLVLPAMEEEPGPSSSETMFAPEKKSRQSRELARLMCQLTPKTWAIDTQVARLKKATNKRFDRWRCCREKQKTSDSNDEPVSQRPISDCTENCTIDPLDALITADMQRNELKRGSDMTDSQNESIRNPKRQCVSFPSASATSSSQINNGEDNDETATGSELKNVNIEMFASNEKFHGICVICDTQQRYLVNHYVREHPESEVFISRISPKSRTLALAGLETATLSQIYKNSFARAFCVFCDTHIELSKSDWIRHLTQHTGEYVFKCVPCDYTCAKKSAHRAMKTCKVIEIRDINLVEHMLYGYICTLCNYVQILEAPMIDHCKEQHDTDKPMLSINYETFKLLDLNIVGSQKIPSPVIMNNCLEMYFSNPKYRSKCVLCDEKASNIVNHFVKQHPGDEIYVSRISPTMCEFLERGIDETEYLRSSFCSLCPFCEKSFNKSKCNWIVHLTRHTGEYLHRCGHCDRKLSGGHCSCQEIPETTQVHSLEYEDNCLYGYLCKLCNYLQLFEENIIPHVKNHHGIDDADVRANFNRLKLFKLNMKKGNQIEESVPCESSDNNQVSVPSMAEIIVETDHTYSLRSRVLKSKSVTPSNGAISGDANTKNYRDKTNYPGPIPSYSEKSTLPVCPQSHVVTEQMHRNCLKPWTTSSAIKNEIMVKFMLNDACLFALFKCLSANCIYSTNSADEMLRHLKHHQLFDGSLDVDGASKLYLECAYCTEVAQSNKELVQHVQDTHFSSIFMCQHCFYRSVDVYGVLVHLRKHHMGMEEVIVVGNIDRMIDISREVNSLVEQRNDNIVPIPSTSWKYFVKDQLVWHLNEKYSIGEILLCPFCSTLFKLADIRNHLSIHGYSDFQCLHCPYGSDDLDEMRAHMADFHSNRLLFVWGRRYRRDIDYTSIDPLNVESTIIINIAEAVDNLGVRFREIGESMQNSLNLMILPQFVSPESWRKFIESMDAPVKLHEILRGNILQQSSKNLISWTDFKTNYMERESAEMCRKVEDNLGTQITMLPNLFPYYKHK